MAAGEEKHSKIVASIAEAEGQTTGEIRVHLSRHWIEPNAFARATYLFKKFGMTETTHRNAVLLYVNLRKRKLAVIGDISIHAKVGQRFWDELMATLQVDLRSTYYENAISTAVLRIGQVLKLHFPLEGENHSNELPNIVTED
ncbi:MAG: TPM domain-containing protein [Oligoflexia bacterium]|nr:TPM domain-containing protein [Oligoflexia bacterium]